MISYELLFAILAGISAKCYDDFTESDENPLSSPNSSFFSISPYILEFLKQFHTLLFTTISIHDYAFAIPMYIGNLLNSLFNPKAYSPPYENSLKYVFIIPCIISLFRYYQLTKYDLLIIVLYIGILGSEPLFPLVKDDGIYKMIFRMMCGFTCIGILYILNRMNIEISSGVKKLELYAIGYFLTSAIFQYIMIRKSKENKNKNSDNFAGNLPENSRILPVSSSNIPLSKSHNPIDQPPNATINISEIRVHDDTIEKSGKNTIIDHVDHSENHSNIKLEISRITPDYSRDPPLNSSSPIPITL
jgi:hypothetical protein